MRFDQPATTNPIDQGKVVGRPTPRVEGPLKVTGTAPYAYEHPEPKAAVGYVVGAGIAKGRVARMDLAAARKAPGVLAIVTAKNAGKLGKGNMNTAKLLGGPQVDHYHQALAVVVAETFEQARAAAALIGIRYEAAPGRFDLAVNGGGELVVSYAKDGYFPADRKVRPMWEEIVALPAVGLRAPDPKAETITLGGAALEVQIHEATPVEDEDGPRTTRLSLLIA